MALIARMKRELSMLASDPPSGVSCWNVEDSLVDLEAQIIGTKGSVYEGGVFNLTIAIPQRYPFEPPRLKFITKIYHPNIDDGGRICLDLLKMPPAGSWKPALNISTVLTSLQLLMNEPNPDDALMATIAREFKHDRETYEATARQWCKKFATATASASGARQEDVSEGTTWEKNDKDVPQSAHASKDSAAPTRSTMAVSEPGIQRKRGTDDIPGDDCSFDSRKHSRTNQQVHVPGFTSKSE
eukprot:m.169966 g.169966  ORF g.169966 m.169966 type:complete len:242 (+) comp18252_c0_seq3:285-1010(+)